MKITGKVMYQNLGTGFWSIVDKQGKEWRPTNMPEQLKHEGSEVSVVAKEVDEMSVFMWGTAVEIVSFQTVTP